MLKRLRNSSTQLARPRPQVLHGIEIKKQPVGRYFEVMDSAGAIVMDLLEAAFPGQQPRQIIENLTKIDAEQLRALMIRLMGQLPRQLVQILRGIVGADDNPAWDELTPAEMAQVCKRFWEVNDMTDFFANARSAYQQMLPQMPTPDTGSSD